MNDDASAGRRHRRWGWALASLAAIVLVLAIAVSILSRPSRATPLILDAVGNALGLEITATSGDYRLSGTPMLDVRGVVAREPGADRPLLRADRIVLSLPWSTIRSRGQTLAIDSIQAQRPVVDIAALQHWLQQRPPGKTRIPTLARGLHVTDGSVVADAWTITGITLDLPMLAPARRVAATFAGRYRSDALQVPFDLNVVISAPAADAAIGIAGHVEPIRDGWRMPAGIVLSGMLHANDGGWRLMRTRLQASARYEAQDTRVPFALGIAGTLQQRDGRVQLSPAAISMRGQGAAPNLDARGDVIVGSALDTQLAGALQAWPDRWPQLPSPLDRSKSPLPFRIAYSGKSDLSAPVTLQLGRDDVRFGGHFRVPDISAWLDAGMTDPLPPLDGHLVAPRIDIAGATLQGVDATLDDPAVPEPAMQ